MNSDSTKLRVGLVGAGAIAQAYVAAFPQCGSAQLAGVADIRTEAARSLAEMAGCDAHDDLEQMVAGGVIDAVLICTPPATHRDLAIWALERRIPVLCEKPLATSSVDAQRMQAVATSTNTPLVMASKFRYVSDVVAAKSLLDSGVLGEIVLFENVFTSRVDMSRRWNSQPDISGGGVLIDNGTHSVDLLRYLLGSIEELQVAEGKRIQPINVEDTVRLSVRTEDGALGSIDLSWSINKNRPDYISVYGVSGTLQVGWKASRFRRSADSQWTPFGCGYNKQSAFRTMIDNFALHVLDGAPLMISSQDALASVRVIESAYKSLYGNTWQKVAS